MNMIDIDEYSTTNPTPQHPSVPNEYRDEGQQPPQNPLEQSLSQWLSSNGLPSEISTVLSTNGIDKVELLSHCDKSEITGLSKLLAEKLPNIFTYGTF